VDLSVEKNAKGRKIKRCGNIIPDVNNDVVMS